MERSDSADRHTLDRPIIVLNVMFWAAVTLLLSTFGWLTGGETWVLAGKRLITALVGLAFTLGMSAGLIALRTTTFHWQAIAAFLIALPAAVAYYSVCYFIYYVWGATETMPIDGLQFVRSSYFWIATFFAWTSLFVAYLYSLEVRDRERRLAAANALAFDAQLQALRYQINPHFLFNTLNSIAEMIVAREVRKAETMVLSLSDFLRSTLTLDPLGDVTVGEELQLQSRYLSIEQERFEDRLAVDFDCPHEIRAARLPTLLLQPIVENAVKHSVGAIEEPVTIRVRVRAQEQQLVLDIENDAREGVCRTGLGVGLRNVRERLAARYGDASHLQAAFVKPDLYAVRITLPLVFG